MSRPLNEYSKEELIGLLDNLMEAMIQSKQLRDQMLGATGKYPEGKISDDDEGELAFSIGISDDNVIIDFGKQVTWIGLPADQAIWLARLITDKAKAINEAGPSK